MKQGFEVLLARHRNSLAFDFNISQVDDFVGFTIEVNPFAAGDEQAVRPGFEKACERVFFLDLSRVVCLCDESRFVDCFEEAGEP